MSRIEWLTYEHFGGRVGERFEMTGGDGASMSLELVRATELSELGGRGPEGQERRQFALVFQGPATPVVPQAIYSLVHDELGELDLFLVPTEADADRALYQASFA